MLKNPMYKTLDRHRRAELVVTGLGGVRGNSKGGTNMYSGQQTSNLLTQDNFNSV
jgi:hypothetical protein